MNADVEIAYRATQGANKILVAELALKDAPLSNLESLLAKYRSTCEDMIFLDFHTANEKKIESKLWEAHGKVNARFRSQLAKFKDGEDKKKPVEKRKTEKLYLDFIKSSQRFYRGYIQRLASHFSGVPEVLQVAHEFKLETLSADKPVQADEKLHSQILISCHSTLIHLGDLSRYRETELQSKERNWGPAKGYYDLAMTLDPSSGASYNQLAVIALADENHFNAIYYLYRAISVKNPFPTSRANLELDFKKVIDRHKKNALLPPQLQRKPGDVLKAHFVFYHASCYSGVDFKQRSELENEILTHLAVDLKEYSLDGIVNRLTLINIAADHLARQKFISECSAPPQIDYQQDDSYDERAEIQLKLLFKMISAEQKSPDPTPLKFFLTFNIKTFFALLQILSPELSTDEGLTPTACRILPSLRHYSSWLICSYELLLTIRDENMIVQIQELWKRYAEVLTLMASFRPVADMPVVEYLLEEDLKTLAFTPFLNERASPRHQTNGRIKPKMDDVLVNRLSQNDEMLARIRDFLSDSLQVVRIPGTEESKRAPIYLRGGAFVYEAPGFQPGPAPTPHVPNMHSHTQSVESVTREDIQQAKLQNYSPEQNIDDRENISEAATTSASISTKMHEMVDGLVNDKSADDQLPALGFSRVSHKESPQTPTLGFGEVTEVHDKLPGPVSCASKKSNVTAIDLVRNMQRPQPLADQTRQIFEQERGPCMNHPSPWSSAFDPPPNSLGSPLSRPETSYRVQGEAQTPPLSSSSALFQQDLLRRKENLLTESSPFLPPTLTTTMTEISGASTKQESTSSWSALSPWTHHSAQRASSPYFGQEIPREAPQPAMFGAIGQAPPSAQPG